MDFVQALVFPPVNLVPANSHYSLVSFRLIDANKDHLQVSVEKLHPKQVEHEVEIRGPPVSKAFDTEGNPTKVEWIEF